MTNNDILRRVRYAFDFNDSKMIALFGLADFPVTREQTSAWLKKDDDPARQELTDRELALFLNGLIIDKRGRRDGPQPEPEQRLNNNIIFRKLRIALNLKDDDILEILALDERRMSKHELSAFFRKPGHNHYRACMDQVLRNFIKGLQIKYRGEKKSVAAKVKTRNVESAVSKPSVSKETASKPAFQWKRKKD
ncbi:hypothetical protein MMIC_P1244 [Mariprofundus micogutta]|uniref:DUF1456 domain-containing protein n=1 Tax=Mariprofundus micogutta TaxID=1921010 RepID=A0A1L8CN71_9PROT|nr:DUF1456 family protein [Mariprofundus micogutta]GAV20279.1 hypothetical protein MMIC_P1244 [Mariprofundus micogutta]